MTRLLLFLITILPLAHAQENIFRKVFDEASDTYVEATSLFSEPSLGGYHPVRIVISNNQNIPHKIFINFHDKSQYNKKVGASSNFSFTTEPNKTTTHDILVPLSPHNSQVSYHSLNVSLTGTMGKTETDIPASFTPCVLLSDTLHKDNASSLDSILASRGIAHSTGFSGSANFSSRFSPKQLPDDWRAFSGFDSIIMTDDDWLSSPPGARNAIISWLRLGGQLIIYSQTNSTLPSLSLPTDSSFGQILIKKISSDLRMDHADTVDTVFKSDSTPPRLQSLTHDFSSAYWPAQSILGSKVFNYISFIIILIAFGIIVGPVNLFVFAKSGRRHRLFITTPIISLLTSLILIALIIFQDGFGGDGKRVVLMEIRPDENQNAAFVIQEQFARTGVMTSSNFTIDASAYITPVPITNTRWSRFTNDPNVSGNYDLQPSGSKTFASGSWFQSRSEQGHFLQAVVPTRGRIEATEDPNTFISTFDFPIQTILYKDPSGNWLTASNMKKGERITLQPIDINIAQNTINEYNDQYLSLRNRSFLNKVRDRNDHFIALTQEAPGIDTHSSINWDTTTIITGPIAR
jgi:hypothetical protein